MEREGLVGLGNAFPLVNVERTTGFEPATPPSQGYPLRPEPYRLIPLRPFPQVAAMRPDDSGRSRSD
jgi:hypothetical protein